MTFWSCQLKESSFQVFAFSRHLRNFFNVMTKSLMTFIECTKYKNEVTDTLQSSRPLKKQRVNTYTARPGHKELIFNIKTCVVFPLLELLSDRRLVEIQTSCSLLRGLLTPCYLFSVLDQKTKWHRTSVFSKNKKPQTTPCYNS